jgi:hypothetical protein
MLVGGVHQEHVDPAPLLIPLDRLSMVEHCDHVDSGATVQVAGEGIGCQAIVVDDDCPADSFSVCRRRSTSLRRVATLATRSGASVLRVTARR